MKKTNLLLLIASTALLACALTLAFFSRFQADTVPQAQQIAFVAGLAGLIALAATTRRERATSGGPGRFEEMALTHSASALTFEDVAANDEARRSLIELVDYLKAPEKYEKMGARMPRGVLLYGPPGTGKTLLAKALAGEANVPFFALSGSDFVQMYVGVGASRVRDLFARARKAGKCVIFIDEIDAMGKKRDESASDEREQTLNALLSEMSGFHPNDGTIILAATNRIDSLDPALLRPGRFDRQIEVGLPGRDERLSILKLHSRNKPIERDVDFDSLALNTAYFSGASLESLLNEAAIRAARRGAKHITREDIDQAYLTSVAGEDRENRATHAERCVIALHEAGHALATKKLLPDHTLTRVSTLPTGKGAAGYSLSIPPEKTVLGKDRLLRQIRVLLAGRAAELLLGGDNELTSGAANDLKRAAELIATMVMDLGMENEPGTAIRALSKACGTSDPKAYKTCRDALNREFDAVTKLLSDHVAELTALTGALIEKEALTGEQINAIVSALPDPECVG